LRQKSDKQSQANQQRHPAGAELWKMELKTQLAGFIRLFWVPSVVLSEFRVGVFGQVGAQVKVFEQPAAQNEKGKEKKSRK